MSSRINSLTVRNFRSIRGDVTVPMNASIVLIHGKNGAGKTSLLSGMELAMTGQLASLDRIDPNLRRHLVNRGCSDAFVSASRLGEDSGMSSGEFRIDATGPKGTPLLPPHLARHFSERCYLAQSTLGRLLELYQPRDVAATASPLTRFVKELLGLDALDALIDGLHDAGDVRRLRGHTNMYWEVRDRLPIVQQEIGRLARESSATEGLANDLFTIAQDLFEMHWPAESAMPTSEWLKYLTQLSYETDLEGTTQLKREIASLSEQWRRSESAAANRGLMTTAETAATDTDKALQAWLQTVGRQLSDAFQELSAYFSDLPSPLANRPEYARATAMASVNSEIQRCEHAVAQDDASRKRATEADADRKRHQDRLKLLDEQIGRHSQQAGQLAQVLSALLPHVHSSDCPVCNRDFAEISTTPLVGHLATKVSSLAETAGRLEALSKERSETITAMSVREREVATEVARQLAPQSKQEIESRLKKLREQLKTLNDLASETVRGEGLFKGAATAGQSLVALRASNQDAVAIRGIADKIAAQLKVAPVGESESLSAALQRFMAHVLKIESKLAGKNTARQRAEAALREHELKRRAIQDISDLRKTLELELRGLTLRKTAGDRVIDQAKELTKLAVAERTDIVRSVFNNSLNTTWKDLFVRLAPDEPFVPAFALPKSAKGPVEASLETLHRDGGKGGNPRAMLSAGNLNTAALTLFLALHLSAKTHLPWLVIDDPVQSMDEVHISQFAALLRTLAKQHDRQIIVAVHEKPLFDYLALELSPSFDGDSLITIELGRAANGDSLATTQVISWEPDTAVAA